ncbi:hypothetical protein ANCCAN_00431 [Ancylostoma caninum]|uniref:Uncharacterized protein n=1 Tax=Ancylostoma caninum TaxID=29170 RepID=A0A368HCE1_ANCCA|nr:hypothetical protein ANCCAN_00431 [Ancylostoma caninum]
MEKALVKYRSALVYHVKCSYPKLEHEAVMERIQALVGVLPYMEMLNEIDKAHLTRIVLDNKGDMRGRLTNEIHVNSTRVE